MPRKKTAKKTPPADKPLIKPISVRLPNDDWGKLREIRHAISAKENREYSMNATIVFVIRDMYTRVTPPAAARR